MQDKIGEIYLNSMDRDGTGQGYDFEILDLYDDYFDNNEDLLICNRSFRKNDQLIKIKIIYQNEEYTMYYNLEVIHGFDNIMKKIDLIL
jgi:hypothetical protein